MHTEWTILLPFLLALFVATACFAWQGKVVGIADEDTMEVVHGEKAEKVRLYGIDAPEKHQNFGTRTKQFTSSSAIT
jgi:micrococcal nuclease